jgi:hypothetical protein
MKKKTDDYINIRMWVKTMNLLKVRSIVTGKSIIETMHDVTIEAFEHMAPVQITDQQDEAIMEIRTEEYNRLVDRRLREDEEFRKMYEEIGERVKERERQNSDNS